MGEYDNFRILLDNPAQALGLGFDAYADALAGIVQGSTPEFAVGIFGTWGSGKTTLMHAIEDRLKDRDDIVAVWFTAWRYEKEQHLIVPLLDVLREELERQPAQDESGAESPARKAARAVARAGLAFLAGVKLTAKTPVMEASWEPGKTFEKLQSDDVKGSNPLSFYHWAFVELRQAISDFSKGGDRRIVVFIDDLDRCLPENALDVLESMKLFFDVEGFVFVVGLDQTIAELAVRHKYANQDTSSPDTLVSGTDYIKKIFQIPFALPRISTDQLEEYLDSVLLNAAFDDAQAEDFNDNVRAHLAFLSSDNTVNPREVKRLINTYVLQMKMLAGHLKEPPDPNVVLALQCLSFRPDWRYLYDHLAADPQLFQTTFEKEIRDSKLPTSVWLSGTVPVPAEFVDYLRGPAAPLLTVKYLGSYVSAAETTHSSRPSILEAQTMLGQIRQMVGRLADSEGTDLPQEIRKRLEQIPKVLARERTSSPAIEDSIQAAREQIDRILVWAMTVSESPDINKRLMYGDNVRDAVKRMAKPLEELDRRLRELRRQASIGPRDD